MRLEAFIRRTTGLSDGAALGAIGVLFGLNFVDEFDRIAFATLTPEIRDAFHLSDTGIASVSIITGLFLLFAAVPLGALADRTSRVRLSVFAAILWSSMSILTGIVPALALLVVARFLSGVGRGMNEIVHPSLLTDLYEPADQPAVFSMHRLANPASAIAAIVAGAIGATIGWRWAFVLLALPTIPLVLAVRRIPEPERGRFGKPVIEEDEELPEQLGVRASARALMRVRTLRRLWAGAAVVGMAAVPAAVFMTLFFEHDWGFNSLWRGVAQVVLGIGGAAGLLLAGRLAPRNTEDAPDLAVHLARWLGLSGIGILCTALAPFAALSVAALVIVGLGNGGLQPLLLALIGRVTPADSHSLAFGMTALFLGLGAILSLALFGVGESTGYRTALVVAGVLVMGAAALINSARSLVERDLADAASTTPVA